VRSWMVATVVVPLGVAAGMVVVPGQLAVAGPLADARAAAAYAASRGVAAGVAVLDTHDGSLWLAGEHDRTFSSASVVKVMIAARLLVSGQMRGYTASRATKMITGSDDSAANALYGKVGGDGLINWAKAHYDVPSLGGPPTPPGRWGNTRITARGLVHLYHKLKADPQVAPWLLATMHRATRYGSDGRFQFFGIPAAAADFAIKQGWNCCDEGVATFNSTGYVDDDRYAVALLVDGPPHTYGTHLATTLDGMARALFPRGRPNHPTAQPPAPARPLPPPGIIPRHDLQRPRACQS
jgi:Beta-lactamase enzyme family